jgi:hypothetical protein
MSTSQAVQRVAPSPHSTFRTELHVIAAVAAIAITLVVLALAGATSPHRPAATHAPAAHYRHTAG